MPTSAIHSDAPAESSVRVRLSPSVNYAVVITAIGSMLYASWSVGQQLATQAGINERAAERVAKLDTDTALKITRLEGDAAAKIARLELDLTAKITRLDVDTTARFAGVDRRYDAIAEVLDKVRQSQFRTEEQISNWIKTGGRR